LLAKKRSISSKWSISFYLKNSFTRQSLLWKTINQRLKLHAILKIIKKFVTLIFDITLFANSLIMKKSNFNKFNSLTNSQIYELNLFLLLNTHDSWTASDSPINCQLWRNQTHQFKKEYWIEISRDYQCLKSIKN
jgi:hypothetical protein